MIGSRSIYLVAIGGNLPSAYGSPASTLCRAVGELAAQAGMIRAVSRFYSNPSFPPGAGPDYVNAVVAMDADLEPNALLSRLHEVERSLGRTRLKRWGARTLDLDLIARGAEILPDSKTQSGWMALAQGQKGQVAPEQLIMPHPRLQERAFVLVPMHDIWPDWVHPVLGQNVGQMLAALAPEEIAAVRAM